MTFPKRVGPVAFTGAALAITLGAVVSCSKQPTRVDAAYTQPEGRTDGASQLLAWPAVPVTTLKFEDLAPADPGPEDRLIGTRSYNVAPPGTVLGMVLDGTKASAYQVMRREPNGGLRTLSDFVLNPTRRWLDSRWEVYEFSDARPYDAASYIGRGLVSGVVTPDSPLTNEGHFAAPPVPDLPLHFSSDTTGTWDAVTGADHYLVHIYQLRQATPEERILSSSPAPFYRGKSRDSFLALASSPQPVQIETHFRGSLPPSPNFQGTVLTRRGLVPGSEYLVRVAAIGAEGELLAFSYGDSDIVTAEGNYERFAQGAYVLPRPRPLAAQRFGFASRGALRP